MKFNWQDVLVDLKLQMTTATFDALLRESDAQLDPEKKILVVFAQTDLIKESLENRLYQVIKRAAESRYGKGLDLKFRVQTTGEYQPELIIAGDYHELRNKLIRPERVFVGSQYFRKSWLPLLGPITWLLILELRQRCYYNRDTSERRDECEATYAELGAAIARSSRTVERALNPANGVEKELLSRFVLGRKVEKVYSGRLGKVVSKATRYTIALDDPLTPDDEERLKGLNGTSESPTRQNVV